MRAPRPWVPNDSVIKAAWYLVTEGGCFTVGTDDVLVVEAPETRLDYEGILDFIDEDAPRVAVLRCFPLYEEAAMYAEVINVATSDHHKVIRMDLSELFWHIPGILPAVEADRAILRVELCTMRELEWPARIDALWEQGLLSN